MNVAPIYLSHVTIFGSPVFENSLTDRIAGGSVGCRAFLKIYEGRKAIYTSGLHFFKKKKKTIRNRSHSRHLSNLIFLDLKKRYLYDARWFETMHY